MAAPLSSIHPPLSARPKPSSPALQRRLLSPHRIPLSSRRTVRLTATPESISEKVSESIKKAEEACEGDPKSGECAAAWDEVEELSAAASHARDRARGSSDPLESYCEGNPETRECRTYED